MAEMTKPIYTEIVGQDYDGDQWDSRIDAEVLKMLKKQSEMTIEVLCEQQPRDVLEYLFNKSPHAVLDWFLEKGIDDCPPEYAQWYEGEIYRKWENFETRTLIGGTVDKMALHIKGLAERGQLIKALQVRTEDN